MFTGWGWGFIRGSGAFSNLPLCPPLSLRDTLTAMAAVAEGTCSMASFDLQDSAKAFAEARLNARQSAAKAAPDLARRGVVRASPLSSSLFDQAETDRVFNSVPTVIQVQQPQPQR